MMDGRSTIIFMIWIVGFVLCITIESTFQVYYGVFGYGIISAIFLHVLLNHDLRVYLELKKREANKK